MAFLTAFWGVYISLGHWCLLIAYSEPMTSSAILVMTWIMWWFSFWLICDGVLVIGWVKRMIQLQFVMVIGNNLVMRWFSLWLICDTVLVMSLVKGWFSSDLWCWLVIWCMTMSVNIFCHSGWCIISHLDILVGWALGHWYLKGNPFEGVF